MYIDVNTIIVAGAVVTALLTIGGIALAIIKWVFAQNKQTDDLASLRVLHEQDIQSIRDELCMLSYAMLAALDGLKQLNCNGAVTKAHNDLEKHLNKQAHHQH